MTMAGGTRASEARGGAARKIIAAGAEHHLRHLDTITTPSPSQNLLASEGRWQHGIIVSITVAPFATATQE